MSERERAEKRKAPAAPKRMAKARAAPAPEQGREHAGARPRSAPLTDREGNLHAFGFRIGGDVPAVLARAAKEVAANGPVTRTQLRRLQRVARGQGPVTDAQRMFLAGLLDAGNARALARMRVSDGASVDFSLASIRAGMPQVKRLGHQAMPGRGRGAPHTTRRTPAAGTDVASSPSHRSLARASSSSSPTSTERASEPALNAELGRDLAAIKSDLHSAVYTDWGVEERVIARLRRWADEPVRPQGTPPSYWINRVFVGLAQATDVGTLRTKYVSYYDLIIDNFDRVDEVRAIADNYATVMRGVASEAQATQHAEEQAELRETELAAEKGEGWKQNVAVREELPATVENLAKANLVIRELARIPDDRQTQVQRSISLGVSREGARWLLRGVHFVTEEERTRWQRYLVKKLVMTTLEFAALYVGGEVLAMFAPELFAASIGARLEAGAAAPLSAPGAAAAERLTAETAGEGLAGKELAGDAVAGSERIGGGAAGVGEGGTGGMRMRSVTEVTPEGRVVVRAEPETLPSTSTSSTPRSSGRPKGDSADATSTFQGYGPKKLTPQTGNSAEATSVFQDSAARPTAAPKKPLPNEVAPETELGTAGGTGVEVRGAGGRGPLLFPGVDGAARKLPGVHSDERTAPGIVKPPVSDPVKEHEGGTIGDLPSDETLEAASKGKAKQAKPKKPKPKKLKKKELDAIAEENAKSGAKVSTGDPELDAAVDQAFDDASVPRVKGKAAPTIDGRPVPGPPRDILDAEDLLLRPGERLADAIARINTVIGRRIAGTPLEPIWKEAKESILDGRTIEEIGKEGMLGTKTEPGVYDKVRNSFWGRVGRLPEGHPARIYLEKAGFEIRRNAAPTLKVSSPDLAAEQVRLSLDHNKEKALAGTDNWKHAVDEDELTFEFQDPNSFREAVQKRMKLR